MNILLTNYSEVTYPGGVHKTITEIAKHLSKKKHNVTVIQANSMDLPAEEMYEGFKIIRIKSVFGNRLYGLHPEFLFFIKKYYKLLKPDIIHLHGYHTLYTPELVFLFKMFYPNTPLVFSPHLDIANSTIVGNYLWDTYAFFGAQMFKSVAHIISCSNYEANNISNIFNVNSNAISVISHGVDNIDITKYYSSNNCIQLIYTGHLIKRKRVDYILRGVNSLIFDYGVEKVLLTIVGEGPEKTLLLDMTNNLNLNDKVIFKSFLPRDELIQQIKNSDIFLLLSASEAYGIVVAEALSQGTPCIVSNNTALNEFTTEVGCYGIDYPPDSKKLASLILDIYQNKPKVGPLSHKIRTWDSVTEDYIKLYHKIACHSGTSKVNS